MEQQFKIFLIKEGYSEYTPSRRPSTVYDYIKRVKSVIEWENLTWDSLSVCISKIIAMYGAGGSKEEIGRKSHNAYISALRVFKKFVDEER